MNTAKKSFIEGAWTCDEFEYLQNNIWEFKRRLMGRTSVSI